MSEKMSDVIDNSTTDMSEKISDVLLHLQDDDTLIGLVLDCDSSQEKPDQTRLDRHETLSTTGFVDVNKILDDVSNLDFFHLDREMSSSSSNLVLPHLELNLGPELEKDPLQISELCKAADKDNSIRDISTNCFKSSEDKLDLESVPAIEVSNHQSEMSQDLADMSNDQNSKCFKVNILKGLDRLTDLEKDNLQRDNLVQNRFKELEILNLEDEIIDNLVRDTPLKVCPSNDKSHPINVKEKEDSGNVEDETVNSWSRDEPQPTKSKTTADVVFVSLENDILDISLEDKSANKNVAQCGSVNKKLHKDISFDDVSTVDDDVITLGESDNSSNDESFQKLKNNIFASSKRKSPNDVLDSLTDASPSGDEIVLSDDNDESTTTTSLRCSTCSQYLDNISEVDARSKDVAYVDEASLVKDPRVAVQGLDEDEEQQFTLFDFNLYDENGHLVPLDSELIEKGRKIRFNGRVQGVFNSSSTNEGVTERLDVYDCGPIEGWWITGLYSGEAVNIGISTARAFYFLRDPSHQYSGLMNTLNEKVSILKAVYQVLEDVKLNEDLDSFTYEDLLENLVAQNPDLDATHLLLQHGAFIVQQILSFEEAGDEDESSLISTPLIQTMCSYSGYVPQKSSRTSASHRLPSHETPASRGLPIQMTRATTTPLVRHFFEHLFKDQLAKSNHKTSSIFVECGVCPPCLRQECGQCSTCRKKSDFGGKGSKASKETCVKKQCEKRDMTHCTLIHIDDDEEDPIKNSTKKSGVKWIDPPVGSLNDKNETFYRNVQINFTQVSVGDFVLVRSDDPNTAAYVCKILYMFEGGRGQVAHVAHYCRSHHTVLGETADPKEVFPIFDCENIPLYDIMTKIDVTYWSGPSNWTEVGGTPESMWTPNSKQDESGYWYRLQYDTETARFEEISPILLKPTLEDGSLKSCKICQHLLDESEKESPQVVENGFTLNGEIFQIGDSVFFDPETFEMENNIKKGYRVPKKKKVDPEKYPEYYRKWLQSGKERVKGNYARISDPFQVGIIQDVASTKTGNDVLLTVRKLYRPENTVMSLLDVGRSDLHLLYWTDDISKNVPAMRVVGKCVVLPVGHLPHREPVIWAQNGSYRFYFEKTYNVRSQEFVELSEEALKYRPPSESLKLSKHPKIERPLRTLDVFAGCGGLSAGLESSGASKVKWAIEVYPAAASAFGLNHSEAKVINLDCNEVLKIAMDEDEAKIRRLGIPTKGDVELLCGGPPCQGFSTMNSFTEREYSQFKNSCIVSYLSFCDFYRPKFFILENVRNFFMFKKSVMLKLCLSALVRMGYQVTFGVLQSGNFGIPQTRLRAFIIAAAPGQKLPKFPEPQNVFEKFSLRTLVDEKGFEQNVGWTNSAPYRNVTTREAISDLPEIESGEIRPIMRYDKQPESHFQKLVRWSDEKGEMLQVTYDHVTRKVPPLTQARMALIPHRSGSDWRDLPNIRYRLYDGNMTEKLKYRYKGQGVCRCMSSKGSRCDPADKQNNTIIPWAMVHTGKRNNQWMGCYGRVSNDSYFSTTITLPHPERKQGRVVHPSQDRVVSVRECARSQGFHDSFKFFGTILEKHRQIGNAVPPPVGRALGLQLRKVLAKEDSN